MKQLHIYTKKHPVLICFLLCVAIALYSCGSSGGGGNSSGVDSGSTSNASLFITDNLTTNYEQVIVTVYKVELVKSSTGASLTAFEDALGITYDLRALSGILETLSTGTIPPGSYNRVYITVGEELILVEKSNPSNPVTAVFDASKNKTTCIPGTGTDPAKCILEVTGAVNIIGRQNVVLDFDLKQFKIDTSVLPNAVTAKIVLDADGTHNRYHLCKQDDYQLKGIIQPLSLNYPFFDIAVLKAINFNPPSSTVKVAVDSNTVFTCDDDDLIPVCQISDFNDLVEGMKVELKGVWNDLAVPPQFEAVSVEVDEDDDVYVGPAI